MAGRINPPLPTQTRNLARKLRGNQTDAEQRLWYHLRAGRLGGYKFRRQYEFPPYVVDFYCVAVKLAIELGVDVNAANTDGRTVLDVARASKLEPIVNVLVEKGATEGKKK